MMYSLRRSRLLVRAKPRSVIHPISRHNAVVSAALTESRIALQGLRQLLGHYDEHLVHGKPIVPELSSLDPSLAGYWAEHQRQVIFDLLAGLPWVPIVGALPGGLAIFLAAAKLAPRLLPAAFSTARYLENGPSVDEKSVSAMVSAVRGRAKDDVQQVSMSSLDYTIVQQLGQGSSASTSLSLARARQQVSAWSTYLIAEDRMLVARLAMGKAISPQAMSAALQHRMLCVHGASHSVEASAQAQLLQLWFETCRVLEGGDGKAGEGMHPSIVRHLLLRHGVAIDS